MRRAPLLAVLLVAGVASSQCMKGTLGPIDPSKIEEINAKINIPPQIQLVGFFGSQKVGYHGTFHAEVYETKNGVLSRTTVPATVSFTPADILDVTPVGDHWEYTAMKWGTVTIAYSYGTLSGTTRFTVTE
jgi:hypothetical protein